MQVLLYITFFIRQFFIAMTIYLSKTEKSKNLFWLMVAEVSVHHGREDVAELRNSPHGSQEAEKGNACAFSLSDGAVHIQSGS
jgi:hypothetical protein